VNSNAPVRDNENVRRIESARNLMVNCFIIRI